MLASSDNACAPAFEPGNDALRDALLDIVAGMGLTSPGETQQ